MVHYWVKIGRNCSFLGKTGQDWAKGTFVVQIGCSGTFLGQDRVKWFILGPSGSILGKTGCSGAKFWGKAPGFWGKAAFEMFLHSSGSSGGASGTGGGSEGPSPTLRCLRGAGMRRIPKFRGFFAHFGARAGTAKMAAVHTRWRRRTQNGARPP